MSWPLGIVVSLYSLAAPPNYAGASVREGCARASLLCVNADGRPLRGETMPGRVNAGASIEVKVIDCKSKYEEMSFKITSEAEMTPDRLFHVEKEPTDKNLRGNACEATVLVTARVSAPTTADAHTFRVIVSRLSKAGTEERSESHEARINHGRYYLDVGVLIPLVINGVRKVVVEDTDQPGVKSLQVREDIDVFPALMLHVFPGGRDFGALSSFKVGRGCGSTSPEWRGCRVDRHRRRAANALGLQFGIELDVKHLDRLLFGGLFEPVSGLSFNIGVALSRLEYLKGGYYSGALINTPTGTTSDGSADLRQYIDRYWSPRLYLGVTFSFDIIRTLGERRRSAELKSILPE